jgi:CheY-like chemotaxis protein
MPTILVVDDERPLRELLAAVLAEAGHRVVAARDGRQALEMIASELPDAVVSDVMMPVMTGAELCRRLKGDAATRDLPVVLMSATDERRVQAAGADAFVAKPFDVHVLERLLTSLLENARASR